MSDYSPITSTYTPKFRGRIVANVDVKYLDKMLLKDGLVRPVYAQQLAKVPVEHLMMWCTKHAVYQVPTWELIHWLSREIAGRPAIEICSGKACLGRHLGIRMTDNYMQTWPQVMLYYAAMQQPILVPADDVEELDALEAIRKYKPSVVIGSWVSQKRFGDEQQANEYGPDEHAILDTGVTYIHVGNLGPHGRKRILLRDHRCLNFHWLASRGVDQSENRIWVWDA